MADSDLTAQQAAERMGLTDSHIRRLCIEGRFSGAYKAGRDWRIPLRSVESFTPRPAGRPKALQILTES